VYAQLPRGDAHYDTGYTASNIPEDEYEVGTLQSGAANVQYTDVIILNQSSGDYDAIARDVVDAAPSTATVASTMSTIALDAHSESTIAQ
jgi:hypothetical protein